MGGGSGRGGGGGGGSGAAAAQRLKEDPCTVTQEPTVTPADSRSVHHVLELGHLPDDAAGLPDDLRYKFVRCGARFCPAEPAACLLVPSCDPAIFRPWAGGCAPGRPLSHRPRGCHTTTRTLVCSRRRPSFGPPNLTVAEQGCDKILEARRLR
jgi:hypothetical protein